VRSRFVGARSSGPERAAPRPNEVSALTRPEGSASRMQIGGACSLEGRSRPTSASERAPSRGWLRRDRAGEVSALSGGLGPAASSEGTRQGLGGSRHARRERQ